MSGRARRSAAGRGAAAAIAAFHRDHVRVADDFFASETRVLQAIAAACVATLRRRGTLLFFGNGGSAADAQHLAAEFVNRFARERPGLPAIALTTDTSVLTSIGNDDDFGRIFARQVEALGRRGDLAFGLSTSGRSPNVLEGLRAARRRGLLTVGFTGSGGGAMRPLCRLLLRVPSRSTPRIQEIHILAGHILCALVDDALFPED